MTTARDLYSKDFDNIKKYTNIIGKASENPKPSVKTFTQLLAPAW